MTDTPHYSALSVVAMFNLYNDEAARRGIPKMKRAHRPKDRGEMCKRLALLLAQPRPKKSPTPSTATGPVKRHTEARIVAVEELCRVSHYEQISTGRRIEVADAESMNRKTLRSFGFAYSRVVIAIKKRLPNSKVTGPKLRAYATHIRSGRAGYEGGKLPARRPPSDKGTMS